MPIGARALSLLLLLASISVAVGCNDANGASALLVEMVSSSGDNPADGVVDGTLTVEVRQGDRVLSCGDGRCSSPIRNGVFDLTFPIESFTELTAIHARMEGGPHALVGATPIFSPFGEGIDVGYAVSVVMGEPGHCEPLTVPRITSTGRIRLSAARRDAAAVTRRNLVLVVGGVEDGAVASGRVDFVDQIIVQSDPLDPIPRAVGRARGLGLTEDDSIFLSDGGGVSYHHPPSGPPAPSGIAGLHEGAGFASALASLSLALAAGGAAVLGGSDGSGTAVADVTWLDATGRRSGLGVLTTPRAFAVARDVSGALVVVGGAARGEPPAERFGAFESGAGVPFGSGEIPDGSGGYLARSPSGRTLLWIGWADATGAASTQTILLRDCATACDVGDGPTWDRARLDTAGIETAAGAFWVVGGTDSAFIDRVVWNDETPRIEEGPNLASERPERAGATVFEHASGIVTVAGGEGPDGLRDDIELCFPDVLDPI